MSTRRKTTLTVSFRHIVNLGIQGKSIIEVTILLKELKSISTISILPYYDKDLNSKADCKKVVDIYKVLLSIPLKQKEIMIQGQENDYRSQYIIYAIISIIIKALGCDYITNDKGLFKPLFIGSDISVLNVLNYLLECIEELKQVLQSNNRASININTLVNILVIITTNEKLESDIELKIMSFLTKVLSIIKR